ncbi:MAG: nitroreductase family protein [Candidatus Ratteibacteria bacterium]
MELFEVIEKRRSVRSYEKCNIPKQDIEKILKAGGLAPSGRNIQPYEFIVIDDEKIIKKLGEEVQSCISEASVVIGIIADPQMSKYWLEDISAVTENMLLAIEDLGYASCWIEGTLLPKEDKIKELLKIPKEKRFIIILPIGKAKGEISKKVKKDIREITHHNFYGQKYF